LAFELRYTKSAIKQFTELHRKYVAKHRKVVKCLRKIAEDTKQSGLNSHKFSSMNGPNGEEVWESYVENNTPASWRIFWCYGPDQGEGANLEIITIVAITPHP